MERPNIPIFLGNAINVTQDISSLKNAAVTRRHVVLLVLLERTRTISIDFSAVSVVALVPLDTVYKPCAIGNTTPNV